jgi:hypothetical protein
LQWSLLPLRLARQRLETGIIIEAIRKSMSATAHRPITGLIIEAITGPIIGIITGPITSRSITSLIIRAIIMSRAIVTGTAAITGRIIAEVIATTDGGITTAAGRL